jgi:hypothetical protein
MVVGEQMGRRAGDDVRDRKSPGDVRPMPAFARPPDIRRGGEGQVC